MQTEEEFTLPARLIPDAAVAVKVVDAGNKSHESYHQTIEAHLRHISGAPPFDPAKLKKANQSWRSNFSYHRASQMIERLVIDSIGVVMGSLGMGYCKFKRFEEKNHGKKPEKQWMRDEVQREQFSNDIIATYADLFESDPRTPEYVSRTCFQAKAFGVGFVLKEKGLSKDWLGEAYDIRSVFFPKRSRMTDIDKVTLKSDWPLLKFYQRYLEIAPGSSWNKKGLEELFASIHKTTKHSKNRIVTDDWESIRSEFNKNICSLNAEGDLVRFSKILSEEVDGSTTVSYVAYTGRSDVNKIPTPKHLLYAKNFPDTKIADMLFIVRESGVASTSSGYIQDFRGLSNTAVAQSHRSNLDKNMLRDKSLMAGNLLFRSTTANQSAKFALTVSSVAVVTPVGYSPEPQTLNPNIGPMLTQMQAEDEDFKRDTQQYDSSIAGKLGDRATSTEVNRVASQLEGSRQSKVAISLRDWSKIHQSNIMDLVTLDFAKGDIGKEGHDRFFEELCYLWGSTKDEVKAVVRELICIDLEVTQQDPAALRESISVSQSEFARAELGRQLLTALGNPRRRVDRIMPRMSKVDRTSDSKIHAELQNEVLWRRGNLLIAQDDPVAQIIVHYKLFDDAVASVQQGYDPVAVANYLGNGLDHTAKLLVMVEDDPLYAESFKGLLEKQKQLEQQKKQVEQFAKQKAKEMAAEKQAQSGQMDAKSEREMALKEQESAQKNERTERNNEFTRGQKQENAAFAKQMKSQGAQDSAAMKREQAAADLALSRDRAAAELAIKANQPKQ